MHFYYSSLILSLHLFVQFIGSNLFLGSFEVTFNMFELFGRTCLLSLPAGSFIGFLYNFTAQEGKGTRIFLSRVPQNRLTSCLVTKTLRHIASNPPMLFLYEILKHSIPDCIYFFVTDTLFLTFYRLAVSTLTPCNK